MTLQRATFIVLFTEETPETCSYRIENHCGQEIAFAQQQQQPARSASSSAASSATRREWIRLRDGESTSYAWDDLTAEPPFVLDVVVIAAKKQTSVELDNLGSQTTLVLQVGAVLADAFSA